MALVILIGFLNLELSPKYLGRLTLPEVLFEIKKKNEFNLRVINIYITFNKFINIDQFINMIFIHTCVEVFIHILKFSFEDLRTNLTYKRLSSRTIQIIWAKHRTRSNHFHTALYNRWDLNINKKYKLKVKRCFSCLIYLDQKDHCLAGHHTTLNHIFINHQIIIIYYIFKNVIPRALPIVISAIHPPPIFWITYSLSSDLTNQKQKKKLTNKARIINHTQIYPNVSGCYSRIIREKIWKFIWIV